MNHVLSEKVNMWRISIIGQEKKKGSAFVAEGGKNGNM